MLIEQLLDAFAIPKVGSTQERVKHALESRKGLLLLAAELAYAPHMERARKVEEELLKVEGRMTEVRNALTRAGIAETVLAEGGERWMTEAARVDLLAARERNLRLAEREWGAEKQAVAAVPASQSEVSKWQSLYVRALYGEEQAARLSEPHHVNCQGCSHPVHCLDIGLGFTPAIQKVNALLVERNLGIPKADKNLETLLVALLQTIWERPREEWAQALTILAALALENLQQMENRNE